MRACVICGTKSAVEGHHVGGRNQLAWLTAPLCAVHHTQLHRLLTIAGIDLEYTTNRAERLIRASKAMTIFTCMVLEALHEKRSR
jgi:hypothetical protein